MTTPTEPEALAILLDAADNIADHHDGCWGLSREVVDIAKAHIAALSTPAARMLAGEREAVAWMYDYRVNFRDEESDWKSGYISLTKPQNVRPNDPDFRNIRPLYDHPPAAEPVVLLDALTELLAWDDENGHMSSHNPIPGDIATRIAAYVSATPARTDDAGVGGDDLEMPRDAAARYYENDPLDKARKAIAASIRQGGAMDYQDATQIALYGIRAARRAALSPSPDRGEAVQMAALKSSLSLLESIKQTTKNIWYVDADDPETAVCDTHSLVSDALQQGGSGE